MPAAASAEINTLTRHAWGSLAHSCNRDRVGGLCTNPVTPTPQSPAERRDVAVPMEPECLAREGLGRGCLLTLPLSSCSSSALERSALEVTRHARAASARGPANRRASRRAALAPPCTAHTAALSSTAAARLWLVHARSTTTTQFRPVARRSRTRCAMLRTLRRVSPRAALLLSACGV